MNKHDMFMNVHVHLGYCGAQIWQGAGSRVGVKFSVRLPPRTQLGTRLEFPLALAPSPRFQVPRQLSPCFDLISVSLSS